MKNYDNDDDSIKDKVTGVPNDYPSVAMKFYSGAVCTLKLVCGQLLQVSLSKRLHFNIEAGEAA
jgi:hypothetical protein